MMQPTIDRPDTALKLWVVLARAFDAVERHSRASIARFGLGTTEFGVLEALYHKGELPVCEGRRRILIESGSPTYVVDKLAPRGPVRPRPRGAARPAPPRRPLGARGGCQRGPPPRRAGVPLEKSPGGPLRVIPPPAGARRGSPPRPPPPSAA